MSTAVVVIGITDPQFIELCILLGCDYLEPVKGVGPKTALKLMREHGSLSAVVDSIRGKMAERAAEVAAAEAEAESESEPESEDGGGGMIVNSDGEEEPAPKASPVKKKPKAKKKMGGGGMQLPEHWPWEEAKKLFVTPDVVKGADLEVSSPLS
jgi:flap endonuclease-1